MQLALLLALLAAGAPGGVSAQAAGTMQVTARVLPAEAGWSGLAEARSLVRGVLEAPRMAPATRRAGLVRTRAELAPINGRRRLLVTIHYPHN
jgi:hypothetical protein